MAVRYTLDGTNKYKQNVYNINLDLSGWDKTTIQVVAPSSGSMGVISVYGTNNAGDVQGVTDGNATLATNFNLIQATNLATGNAGTNMSAAGNYGVTLNARFLRLAGGADVYKLLFVHEKI